MPAVHFVIELRISTLLHSARRLSFIFFSFSPSCGCHVIIQQREPAEKKHTPLLSGSEPRKSRVKTGVLLVLLHVLGHGSAEHGIAAAYCCGFLEFNQRSSSIIHASDSRVGDRSQDRSVGWLIALHSNIALRIRPLTAGQTCCTICMHQKGEINKNIYEALAGLKKISR